MMTRVAQHGMVPNIIICYLEQFFSSNLCSKIKRKGFRCDLKIEESLFELQEALRMASNMAMYPILQET